MLLFSRILLIWRLIEEHGGDLTEIRIRSRFWRVKTVTVSKDSSFCCIWILKRTQNRCNMSYDCMIYASLPGQCSMG